VKRKKNGKRREKKEGDGGGRGEGVERFAAG